MLFKCFNIETTSGQLSEFTRNGTNQLLLYKTAAALLALAYNYVQLLIRTAAILCYDNLATTY